MTHEVESMLVRHAVENNCTDPDCELHHPEVGWEEGTVTLGNIAFYVAGVFAGVELALSEMDGIRDNTVDELVNRGLVNREGVYREQ